MRRRRESLSRRPLHPGLRRRKDRKRTPAATQGLPSASHISGLRLGLSAAGSAPRAAGGRRAPLRSSRLPSAMPDARSDSTGFTAGAANKTICPARGEICVKVERRRKMY